MKCVNTLLFILIRKLIDFCGIDIVVCFNKKTMEAVKIPEDTFQNSVHAVEASELTENNPDLVVFVFIAGTMSQYIEKGEMKLAVQQQAYLRQKHQQLEMLGYVPITVFINLPSNLC